MLVEIAINGSEKVFAVIYRHPHTTVRDVNAEFESSLEMLTDNKESYYICGDFNIDLLQTETNEIVKNYADTLYSLGCIPQIKYPTRIELLVQHS